MWGQDAVISVVALTHRDTALQSTSPVVCFQTARVIYSYPSLFDRTQRDPFITVPSSNARTQRSIALTQHFGGGYLCFCCFVFCYFPQASFGSRIYLELFKEKPLSSAFIPLTTMYLKRQSPCLESR